MKKLLLVLALLGVAAALQADTTTIINKSNVEVKVVCTEAVDSTKIRRYDAELEKGDKVMYDSGGTCRAFTVNKKPFDTGKFSTIEIQKDGSVKTK
ncbi:hypothetical protein CVU75_01330 [Candidatus Dependentiae bacterium HGW-Dependentiae-1]|nr:MAG: hypothetical protein CVU75_01330 [Candidatus Dependentiae bacterium HGW-Dependentiae-1]